MKLVAKFLRSTSKAVFSLRNRATILDIPTDRFNDIIKQLKLDGWKQTFEYSGFDAWIDYGAIRLKKNRLTLFFEWDNWTEGSIEGPRDFIEHFAKNNSMPVSYRWRWSEYDNNL
jgi:hypothetical protein